MTLNELRDIVHTNAKAKGFHDTPRTFGDDCALIHSEVSEAYEDYRAGLPVKCVNHEPSGKPVGIPSELADIIIRVLDTCGLHDIDIEKIVQEKIAYNATRQHKHGGKIV